MELLAPAGGMEQLQYALRFGADAVYCATERFGLRQRANNFTLEEMGEAVKLAHEHQAFLYVACNTYMNAEDLHELPAYFEALEQANVDAIIVSDLGALRLAKRHAPKLDVHISTQASCCNSEAASAWYDLGAKRVVCAREMSLKDIELMRLSAPRDLELEVFVHGAMCMAISGRCLISDYLTGRPANKGMCTQPCRWEYKLEEPTRPGQAFGIEEDARGSYIMNSKDLNMLAHLDALREIGVDSIKIEGRNKKAFYVATVVNAYRQVLNGANPAELAPELEIVSHRPYTTGFFFGSPEQCQEHGDTVQKYDWVGEVLHEARDGRVEIACRNRFYEGEVVEVISPHKPLRSFVASDIRLKLSEDSYESVEIASRAMGTYTISCDIPLCPHDILRVERKNPERKN